jgi:hypothetical protein
VEARSAAASASKARWCLMGTPSSAPTQLVECRRSPGGTTSQDRTLLLMTRSESSAEPSRQTSPGQVSRAAPGHRRPERPPR